MTGFLVTALLLCLLKDGTSMATAWDDEDFFRYCPPSQCSNGPEIRFPFRLESSNTSSLCGAPGVKLACSGNDTILVLPQTKSYSFKVTTIDYKTGSLTLSPRVDNSSPSCRQKLMSVALPHSTIDAGGPFPQLCTDSGYAVIVSCLTEFTPSDRAANYIYGPISCLSNTTNFYLVDAYAYQYVLPLDCRIIPDSFFLMRSYGSTFKEKAEGILNFSEMVTESAYYCYEILDVRFLWIAHSVNMVGDAADSAHRGIKLYALNKVWPLTGQIHICIISLSWKVVLQIIWVASLSNQIKAKKVWSKSQKKAGTTCYAHCITR